MGVFSRISDIVSSNINALLDKAEDPEKLINMIVREMEQTLIEVRSSSVKLIAERKELERSIHHAKQTAQQWQNKAELALGKDRDDLARSALIEKNTIEKSIEIKQSELDSINNALQKLDSDLSQLSMKLNEAKAKRNSITARKKSVVHQLTVRRKLNDEVIDKALHKYEHLQKRMDQLEAEVESFDLGKSRSLSEQIDDLAKQEELNQQIEQLKQKVKQAS